MAGDWMKWRKGLAKDPAVLYIAARMKLSRHDAAARCMEVWEWADDATVDGFVPSATEALVDEIAGKRGFASAMASTPGALWLEVTDEGITFPNFERHNGLPAKARAQAMNRQRASRSDRDNGHAASVTKARKRSRSEADTGVTREEIEKETENNNGKDIAPAVADAPPRPARARSSKKPAAWPPGALYPKPPSGVRDGFERLFATFRNGASYGFDGGKDGEAIRVLLGLAGARQDSTPEQIDDAVELVLDRAATMLQHPDRFFASGDLTTLRAGWNRLAPVSAGAGSGKRNNVDDTIAAAKRVAERMGLTP